MSGLPSVSTSSDALRTILRRDLAGGAVDLRAAAKALKVSARTLQRRLHGEGTTFDAIVDDERRIRASALLRRGIGTTEAAFLVGFSDPSALMRARRRWGLPDATGSRRRR